MTAPPEIDWASLTRLPLKAELYGVESYFREGHDSVVRVLGADAGAFLRRTALLVVKPDGMRTGKLLPVREFLTRSGFAVAAVADVTYHRHLWQGLWRYQLTSATVDRLAVNDIVLRGPALLLLLRDEAPTGVPAAVRLSGLKGSANLSRQHAGSLRAVLGQPNRVLSLIHVADEPADVVRELGVFLDAPRRARLLAAAIADELPPEDAAALAAAERAAAAPDDDLDVGAALRRMSAVVAAAPAAEAAADAARFVRAMADGERVCWLDVADALARAGVTLDPWDEALVATSYITYDEPGRAKLIENVEPALWAPNGRVDGPLARPVTDERPIR